jgi:hypothetical protein
MKPADVKGFEEAYSRWAKLKKENRLYPQDQMPRAEDFGLIAWAAEQIRKKCDREINRPV